MSDDAYRAPSDCPVCGHDLQISRVSCPGCGAELAGSFTPCDFCALPPEQLRVLRVFLASRGNLRQVAKDLGVSYPTARLRLTELLVQLGLSGEADVEPTSRERILAAVAAGELSAERAAELLG